MKFKGQNPKSERKKSEAAVCSIQQAYGAEAPLKRACAYGQAELRISNFFRISVFGIRICSDTD